MNKENKQAPEIERDDAYFENKEKKHNLINKYLNTESPISFEDIKKEIEIIIAHRLKNQGYLRDYHKKSREVLEKEYDEKYKTLSDEDFSSTQIKRNLYADLVQEMSYYSVNDDKEWQDSDGETREREFSRGVIMHQFLKDYGLTELEVRAGNTNPDITDLEIAYKNTPHMLESPEDIHAKKFVDFLFDLKNKVDKDSLVETLKEKFGGQEVIFILEDVFDNWEGYRDNTEEILSCLDGNDLGIENFFEKANKLIGESKEVMDRYQEKNQLFLVNCDTNMDNTTANMLPTNWEKTGVTNNFLNALIFDYGNMRASAWENNEYDFVKKLDEEIVEKLRQEGDEQAGKTVIRLTILRSFSEIATGVVEDGDAEKQKKIKKELLKALENNYVDSL